MLCSAVVGGGIIAFGIFIAKPSQEQPQDEGRIIRPAVPFPASGERLPSQGHSRGLSLASLTSLVRDPDEGSASELWEATGKLGASPEETRVLRIQLIEGLVATGQFADARELIDLHAAGEGAIRDSLVFSLFTKSPLPFGEAMELLDKTFTDNPHDRRTALEGLARSLANADGIDRFESFLRSGANLDKDAIAILPPGLAHAADVARFGQYYQDPDLPPPVSAAEMGSLFQRNEILLGMLAEANPEGFNVALGNYLRAASALSPELALDTLDNFRAAIGKDDLPALEGQLARKFGEWSGSQAMEASVESGSPRRTANALLGWYRSDSSSAQAWLEDNFESLPSSQKDAVAVEMVKKRLETKSLEEARKMVDAISDPKARRIAEGWAWTKERDMLRSEVNENASDAVHAIVSGDSEFGDYWLEEAMSVWVTKDFDQAVAWYDKNWDSLPPSKSQYVAAAFANQAMEQGDATTARQWAAMIQDAKTKARIEGAISEAESN